jgi:ABC-type Fe3+-hydroxamate transport system substrate-binding protein
LIFLHRAKELTGKMCMLLFSPAKEIVFIMPSYKDQLQREIILNEFPQRIISLVPSITELLFDLGLENEVVGITKFCVHPETWFRTKTRVGGTKNIKIDVIASLKPGLIIGNKEENVKEQIEQLESIAPVWISDVCNLEDALEMIDQIGKLTDKLEKAKEIIQKIKTKFQKLPSPFNGEGPGVRACYLIWKDPYMSIGSDTFIHDMLTRYGFTNVFAHCKRYPQTSIEEIKNLSPEFIFLSSEPYPFKQKHVEKLQTQLPGCEIILVDGEMFSWYGSRLILAVDYFKNFISKIASAE